VEKHESSPGWALFITLVTIANRKNSFYDELCCCVYVLYKSPSKHLLPILLFSLCVFLCAAAPFKYALYYETYILASFSFKSQSKSHNASLTMSKLNAITLNKKKVQHAQGWICSLRDIKWTCYSAFFGAQNIAIIIHLSCSRDSSHVRTVHKNVFSLIFIFPWQCRAKED